MGDDLGMLAVEQQAPQQSQLQQVSSQNAPLSQPNPVLMNSVGEVKMENKTGAGRDDVCRDYQRGVCQRGDKCKFFHPADIEPPSQDRLPICRDFQNGKCNRINCKYMHISSKDERIYMRTGKLPVEFEGQTAQHHTTPTPPAPQEGNSPSQTRAGPSDPPCKDFFNNICDRGNRCKFRHITEEDWQYEKMYGHPPPEPMARKRRRESMSNNLDQQFLQEENDMLRRKVADMQRQIADLRAMNDTLYEQNMRYRSQLRNTVALSNGTGTDASAYGSHTRDSGVSYPAAMGATTAAVNTGIQSFSVDTYGSSVSYDGYTKFQ